MERLFIMDSNDYTADMPHYVRPSVRAVIIKENMVAMVHSIKYDYYKFPGGGIENGEDHIHALIREVAEETGLTVDADTVKEFGSVLRVQLSMYEENTVFEQENFYYTCNVLESVDAQSLDEYELDEGFTLEYVCPQQAIEVNRTHEHGEYDDKMIERESRVLELIMEMM